VQNNPFRDLKGNPLIEAKIEELVNSIEISGYWDNCIAVKRGGKYCLAYGHHRLEAAKRAGLTEADFIIKDLDDAMLIKVMDLENRETYASSPASMIESVKAVVNALAEGSIPPFYTEVPKDGRACNFRYAPSYVEPTMGSSGKNCAQFLPKAYTALDVAKFLGRTVAGGTGPSGRKPAFAIDAALNFLCLQELGKANNSLLSKDGKPISSTKLIEITDTIKQRHVAEVVRRGKTQAELEVIRAKQLEAQAKAKADEKAAEEAHKALVKKLADAQREENLRKTDALAKQIKDNDARAKEKEALNKVRMAELEKQLAAKKEWEAQQVVQDAYLPIRRDVETLITRWETKVSEHDAEREQVKALAKLKALRPEDRLRLRKAAVAVADHYSDWVAAQFAPLPTVKAEFKEMKKREVAKRKAEKEKA
jgi:hypothetical protein